MPAQGGLCATAQFAHHLQHVVSQCGHIPSTVVTGLALRSFPEAAHRTVVVMLN